MYALTSTPQDISDMTMDEWGEFQRSYLTQKNDFQDCMDQYIVTGDPEWLTLALSEMEEQ
jgi:hypothetical protein